MDYFCPIYKTINMNKKLIKDLIFLFLVLFTFFSCNSDKKTVAIADTTDDRIPVIDIEKAMDNLSNQKMNFSEFVEDIVYIPLETNNQSLIGGKAVPVLNVSENLIFYGDMMFSRDGHFIRKLGKIGQGPEEYVMALDIAVDEERQEFYVYNNAGRNIYIYDFDNKFKKKLPAYNRGSYISSIGKGKILLFRDAYKYFDDYYEYKVIDVETGDILYTRDSGVKEDCYILNTRNLLWRYDNENFYYEGSTDSIFRLNDDGEIDSPRYIINRGKYKNAENENFMRINKIVESGQYLLFNVSVRNVAYYGAFDKQTEKTIINKFD